MMERGHEGDSMVGEGHGMSCPIFSPSDHEREKIDDMLNYLQSALFFYIFAPVILSNIPCITFLPRQAGIPPSAGRKIASAGKNDFLTFKERIHHERHSDDRSSLLCYTLQPRLHSETTFP